MAKVPVTHGESVTRRDMLRQMTAVVTAAALPGAVELAVELAEDDGGFDGGMVSGAGVLITGSVVTAGEARTLFGKDPA